ncbi:acyl-CoA dehydrogenase [Microbulbifer sp. YPW1]|uniref:acyl-CoA dehydrogenase n=1 Tax=Microbulbifer sp. YPW1 TaxID=2745199 RepID=UPI0015992D63|nr:acyl-CoA dehydrogenase [Microbulbifer sp. YPW1]QKX17202.1 acyl-CoA dehydrogenase C-terminal domain-containing protein [Microbulbifer sp. YPW1]
MSAAILKERELSFLLYEMFETESLCDRDRYREHSRETIEAALDTARVVAERHLLPIRHTVDTTDPVFTGHSVSVQDEVKQAVAAIIDSGLASACADFEMGGMQLPELVNTVIYTWLTAAGSAASGYTALTNGNANLLQRYGTPEQIEQWVRPMREGRFAGTMALTEPGAGSGLADLCTSAEKAEDGTYRISGQKIFISGGDHDLNENIVHLVLARVKGAPAGTRGISLFIVPKFLVDPKTGELGARNEVHLSGLFHKMGGRGQTSTALNFGDQGGAVGYLVGEENRGLEYMFQMMNEARIMVGTGAAALALAGYEYSLAYANERPQGRLLSNRDPSSKPVNIIHHPDVRRMLLGQKALSEGAMALCLLGARLSDDIHTSDSESAREEAGILLDFLTPIIKTWSSEAGLAANDMAIQVLGGHGYINEHPVEMFYRDNRINPIHEGTTGIQSLDLLARKVPMNQMQGFRLLIQKIEATLFEAGEFSELTEFVEALRQAVENWESTTREIFESIGEASPELVFANSVSYLRGAGHIVAAWLWIRQGLIACRQLADEKLHQQEKDFYLGKRQAMVFFFRQELGKIYHWFGLARTLESSFHDMQPEWF